jgi:putative toxin-antitoxin system antitoxin component (TIGR02293 family)
LFLSAVAMPPLFFAEPCFGGRTLKERRIPPHWVIACVIALTPAIWRGILGHMTQEDSTMDAIVLKHWPEFTTEAQMQSAFKHKNAWVVDAPRSAALWYNTVLGNLSCSYVSPELATIESVRDILGRGLSRTAFDRLKQITDLSSDQLGKTVRIPQRTLSRRAKFKPEESERILRVASAFQKALEVLGGVDEARRWFVAPKRALGGRTPLEFCDTEPGAQEVEHLLGRIEHGVFT